MVPQARKTLGLRHDLLSRVAEELDAGRPPGPLIGNARFRVSRWSYDIDAVDWFLGQILGPRGRGMTSATWPSSARTRLLGKPLGAELAGIYMPAWAAMGGCCMRSMRLSTW